MQLDLFSPIKGSPPPVWTVRISGSSVPFTLKRSARAKQVWLRIGLGTGLVVVAPPGMHVREVEKVILKKADWIKKHLSHIDEPYKITKKPLVKDGLPIPYLGKEFTLRVLPAGDEGPAVTLTGGEIVVETPDRGESALMGALKGWYKDMARKVIPERVERLSDGHKVGRVSIRDQSTRWGSCSPKGNLSFNLRLMMAPMRVVDYLIIHELTHLEHQNHSKRFWDKVAKRCPKYVEYEEWLKKHGRSLPL